MRELDGSEGGGRPVGLVTGGSRGIGRGIAVELARIGYDLVLNYAANDTAAAEARVQAQAARGDRSGRVEVCRADVADAGDRERLLAFTREKFGRLDLLVNNAGVAPEKRIDLLEADEEGFDHLIRVNLKAPYFLSQAAASWMLEQKTGDAGNRAHRAIINITSVSAYAASPERGAYCVSKAALSMATRLFATRLAEDGINVYEVRPGVIATDMTANVKQKYDKLIESGLTPTRRWGTPEDVGRAVAALASGDFDFSTGQVLDVDGGFHIRRL